MVQQSEHLPILLQLVAQRFDDSCEVRRHEKRNVCAGTRANDPDNAPHSWLLSMALEDLALMAAFPSNGCASGTTLSASTASHLNAGPFGKTFHPPSSAAEI